MSAVQKSQPKTEEAPKTEEETRVIEQSEPEVHIPEVNEDAANDTTKTLEEVWDQIKVNVQELGPRIKQAVQAANPKQLDSNTIKIHITAQTHKEVYEKHKTHVYDVLRVELGIQDLKFEWELVESELDSKRPLKNSEKYQVMAEENPALKLLKEKFNLDIKK